MIISDWETPDGRHLVREWQCCGLKWQMIITPIWEGSFHNQRCPRCGGKKIPPKVPMDRPDVAW